jgi:UDP-N-acetylenolpyruvoylglucosamine reductase
VDSVAIFNRWSDWRFLRIDRLEFLAGIPGTVGGAIYGNAGASDNLLERKYQRFDFQQREATRYSETIRAGFGYRFSNLKKDHQIY